MRRMDEKIEKYLGEGYRDELAIGGGELLVSKEAEQFKKLFYSLDSTYSRMWSLVKAFDKKNKSKIWPMIAKDMQKLEGLCNDVGTKVIDNMKKYE
jgi:hypothetical protein